MNGSSAREAAGTVVVAAFAGAIAIDLYLSVLHQWIDRDATWLQVSQWDASNALGVAAFRGGLATGVLGFAMHYGVCVALTLGYLAVVSRIRTLGVNWLAGGTLLGLVAMVLMRAVVGVWGRATVGSSSPSALVTLVVAHTVFFGWPVAYVVARGIRRIERDASSGVRPSTKGSG